MADAHPASLLASLLGPELGSAAGDGAGNRVVLEGVSMSPAGAGALGMGIARLEAQSLRLTRGPFVLEIGRLALLQVVAQVRTDAGKPQLVSLQAASAELAGVKVQGPLVASDGMPGPVEAAASAWSLAPLADANGTIRAEIVDAHLVFDADVTVPIRAGRIEFRDAAVEHVGPDSRMGVSRLGLYVDAPNGRSYLYQFALAPVAGVEFEKRGALMGPFVTDRGNLRLQEFGEGLLRQGHTGAGVGFTDQARLLFDRTAVSGDLRLGDGRFAAPGVQAELTGRAQGSNTIRLHSEAVGRGLSAEVAALSVRNAAVGAGHAQLACDAIEGALTLRLSVEGKQVRFALEAPALKMTGLQVRPGAATGATPRSSATTAR